MARLDEIVDLPTPPLPEAIAIVFLITGLENVSSSLSKINLIEISAVGNLANICF